MPHVYHIGREWLGQFYQLLMDTIFAYDKHPFDIVMNPMPEGSDDTLSILYLLASFI